MSLLSLDARWRRFNDESRSCPCCDRQFAGIYDIGFDQPSDWPHAQRGEAPFVKEGEDQLSPDLCRQGENRYLRAVLTLPVQGADESVLISPWVMVASETFYAYLETWDNAAADLPGPAQATLANDLPGFATAGEAVTLDFSARDTRPTVGAMAGPLHQALTSGISFDQLLDLYAECGDDIRPHLLRD